MKNIPNRIWIQISDDCDCDDFKKLNDVTWCEDKINENDIEYMNAGWISVEDELPEPEVDVLCCEGDIIYVSRFSGKFGRPLPRTKKRPIFDDPTGYYAPLGEFYVTHWMPLPEKPIIKVVVNK